jgi:uncharacterized lipoprotein
MSVSRFLLIGCLAVTVTGCGLFKGKDELAYKNAPSGQPLVIPEGLNDPPRMNPFNIPADADQQASVDPRELEEPPAIDKSVDLSELDSSERESAPEAQPQTAKVDQPIEGVTSKLTRNSDGESLLLVDAEFEQVWPLVGPALSELGFSIDDSSRGAQIYTVTKLLPQVRFEDEPPHPGDEEEDVKEEYQIHLETMDDKTSITVHNKFGTLESSGLSDHLLLQLKEIIAKPKTGKAG